jgi:threonine dehydratase
VGEDELAGTMRVLASRAKLVAEGSGAAATACLLSGRITLRPGACVVSLLSGGNVDPDRLGGILAS